MKRWLLVFSIIIIFLALCACIETAEPSEKDPVEDDYFKGYPLDTPFEIGDLEIATYIRTWPIPAAAREGGSPYWNAGMIKGEYLSDLIIAFALINSTDGYSLYISDPGFSNIWNEVAEVKANHPHLRVNISVGGYGAEGFSDMADDPALRLSFAANVCQWLESYDLDGVDIDWEYPVGPEWGSNIKVRPEDRQNYITLLQDLRDAMDILGETTGKYYRLFTAVPASNWFLTANDVKAAAEIVDKLKLMSYDYYGSWSNRTGHNANLYRNPRDPAWGGWSTDQAVRAYLAAQIPPQKISLGVAFYGQGWSGVSQGNNASTPGLFQMRTGFWRSPNWADIQELLLPGSGYTRYWDDVAKAPFIYNGGRWVSYTDHEQIRYLTGYAKEKNLGGVFVWEYGHDMGAELLRTLAISSQ